MLSALREAGVSTRGGSPSQAGRPGSAAFRSLMGGVTGGPGPRRRARAGRASDPCHQQSPGGRGAEQAPHSVPAGKGWASLGPSRSPAQREGAGGRQCLPLTRPPLGTHCAPRARLCDERDPHTAPHPRLVWLGKQSRPTSRARGRGGPRGGEGSEEGAQLRAAGALQGARWRWWLGGTWPPRTRHHTHAEPGPQGPARASRVFPAGG